MVKINKKYNSINKIFEIRRKSLPTTDLNATIGELRNLIVKEMLNKRSAKLSLNGKAHHLQKNKRQKTTSKTSNIFNEKNFYK